MREIKFRAWDEKNKKFIKNNDDYDKCEYYGNIFVCLKWALSDCLENYILMQYTGLKDKNGIEIYEGDILRFYSPSEEEPRLWAVQFTITPMPRLDWCEVIGNIYENPNLLNHKEK